MKKRVIFNKAIISIVAINVAQIGLLIGIIGYEFFKDASLLLSFNNETLFFLLIIVISFWNIYINTKDIGQLKHMNQKNKMLEETLVDLEELNKTLRAQRHDFMNHLQVVFNLIELEEFTESKNYMEKVYNDIQSVNRVMRTAKPAFNALLQAKVIACEKRCIEPRLKISSQFKDLKIPDWEFCRVLGNIIDNAIFALETTSSGKYIQIELSEDIKSYYFRVSDNGIEISEEIRNKIFTVGFTTKGDKGDGMGLAITKDIMNHYGGTIKMESNQLETSFEGCIPK